MVTEGGFRTESPHRQAFPVLEFFAARWRGERPLAIVFGRDMLIFGTLINLSTTLASLAVLASGAPFWLGMAVFVLPVPYNLFLFAAVWRGAELLGGARGTVICVIAALWTIGASLI